jgi:hypothetical protein
MSKLFDQWQAIAWITGVWWAPVAIAQFVAFDAVEVDIGLCSYAIETGDLDDDGLLDIVLTNAVPAHSSVTILRSVDGTTFDSPVVYPTGKQPSVVKAGDLDADGDLDLVTSNFYGLDTNSISVLWNDGDGAFGDHVDFPTGTFPHMVTLADVDQDGWLDAMTPDSGGATVSVLLGDEDLVFASPQSLDVNGFPRHIELGDWDDDGDLDAAVALFEDDDTRVLIMVGDGRGVFAITDVLETGQAPLSIAQGDIDGDADLDLVVANFDGKSLSILVNDSRGAFTKVADLPFDSRPEHVRLDDLDLDSDLDISVTFQLGNKLGLLENDGEGGFQSPIFIPTSEQPGRHGVADLDLDGDLDIIVPSEEPGNPILIFYSTAACLADFNADGALDILDFVAFQQAWQDADPAADCSHDQAFNILDFICFQGAFQAGCD